MLHHLLHPLPTMAASTTAVAARKRFLESGSCCAETVLGEQQLLCGNGSWRATVATQKRFLESDSCCAETVLGERLQVLQHNINCLLEEYNQNGSWKEAAGSTAERHVTDRQRGSCVALSLLSFSSINIHFLGQHGWWRCHRNREWRWRCSLCHRSQLRLFPLLSHNLLHKLH